MVQDAFLTANPQITFFKLQYRRHTNFAKESVLQTFNGTAVPGQRPVCIVSRTGDLVNTAMLQVMLPGLSGSNTSATTAIFGGTVANNGVGWVQDVGNVLIDTVSFEIGGQQIDRQYGQWLEIYSQLSLTEEKLLGYNEMVGHWRTRAGAVENSVYSKFYYVPLMFYWNLFVGLSLPLI